MAEYTDEPQKVYVMQHELGPVKIGIAAEPRKRLSQIQIGSPFEITLKKTAMPRNALRVEQYLHRVFSEYRMRGEWFDIPPAERDFSIPTKVEDGIPNREIERVEGRDMDAEWGELLTRLTRAMTGTKYHTPTTKHLQDQWQMLVDGDDRVEDEATSFEADAVDDLAEDIPPGQIKCSQCGWTYDRNERGCPICSSSDAFDEEAFR